MDLPTCQTCAYWAGEEGDAWGECRRNPPIFAPTSELHKAWNEAVDSDFRGMWPDTNAVDWCGEHTYFPAYLRSLASPQDVVKFEE